MKKQIQEYVEELGKKPLVEQKICTYCHNPYRRQTCFKKIDPNTKISPNTNQLREILQQNFPIKDINQYQEGLHVLWLEVMENETKDKWVGPTTVKTIYPN